MKRQLFSKSLIAVVLLAGLGALRVPAQNDPATPATNGAPAKPAAVVADKAVPSAGIADILKMLDAGVSKEVIKTYIENSSTAYNPGPADLILLKEHGVTDDLTLALLKRSQDNKAQAAPAAAGPRTQDANAVQTVRIVGSSRLDPESYEYFQRYYLQPRALSYSYQMLGYQPAPFGYGYYPPVTYSPYFYGRYPYRPRY